MSSNDAARDIGPGGPGRSEVLLGQYIIALSLVMMIFGLRQWAVIIGLFSGAGGPFEDMAMPWAAVTVHIAIVDVVAAVGLWNQAAWGQVLWVYAAIFEIVIHTVFATTFATNWPLVGFHFATLVVFTLLTVMARRQSQAER